MSTQDIPVAEPNKFERLIASSTFALVLLINERSGDWELTDPQPVPVETAQRYAQRGLAFGGVFGLVDGKPQVALAVPLEDEQIKAIAPEFTRRWAHSITHPRWLVTEAPGVN